MVHNDIRDRIALHLLNAERARHGLKHIGDLAKCENPVHYRALADATLDAIAGMGLKLVPNV